MRLVRCVAVEIRSVPVYRKDESPQAMRASVRAVREMFVELERQDVELSWRTVYALLDAVSASCDRELKNQGRRRD
jgi:hypothetical protein